MARLSADKAAKIGDVLFRYMRARHRFRERVEHPLPAHELAALIGHGKVEFDEVYIPDAKPPIVFDGKADDVFDAIIKKKYHALPFWDPQVVAAWRHHVLSDGSLRKRMPATIELDEEGRGLLLPVADKSGRVPLPQPLALRSFGNLDNGSCCACVAGSVRNRGGDLELPDSHDPVARQQSDSDAFGQGR
jgi:hypothetical protein